MSAMDVWSHAPKDLGAEWIGIDELRRRCAATVPGPSVLDCGPKDILSYCAGALSLLQRDLDVVSPNVAAFLLPAWREFGLLSAFRVRQELVNYKKVALHLMHAVQDIQLDLRRLSFFFFVTFADSDRTDERVSRYFDISACLMECRGAALAIEDCRAMTKAICCLPRHPNEEVRRSRRRVNDLPTTLFSYSAIVVPALEFLVSVERPGEWTSMIWAAGTSWPSAVDLWGVLRDAFAAQPWHAEAVDYVCQVHIARGASKALTIWAETARLFAALSHTQRIAVAAMQRCHALGYDDDSWALGDARAVIRARKHYHSLKGCVDVLSDVVKWIGIIGGCGDVAGSCDALTFVATHSLRLRDSKLFLASDGTECEATMFVPKDFKRVVPSIFSE